MIVHNNVLPSEPMYSIKKSKEIMQQGFCVIIEILLRHKTKTNYNGKIWYLTPEEALYNKLAKFRNT